MGRNRVGSDDSVCSVQNGQEDRGRPEFQGIHGRQRRHEDQHETGRNQLRPEDERDVSIFRQTSAPQMQIF